MRRPVIALLASLIAALLSGSVLSATATAAPSSGYNDWTCKPSAAHPRPAVLIHGLGGTAEGNWNYQGPRLAAAGLLRVLLHLRPAVRRRADRRHPAGGRVGQDGRRVRQKVRTSTGARKVDLVGHSEGGFMTLYVPKMVTGVAAKVHTVVSLAPPSHGTTFGGLVTIGQLLGGQAFVDLLTKGVQCFACSDLVVGGAAVKQLTNGPIAQKGIRYTILATRYDALVTPTSTSFVKEPGVRNAYIQDTCPLDPVGHIGIAMDSTVTQLITNALDPSTEAKVACGFGPPF